MEIRRVHGTAASAAYQTGAWERVRRVAFFVWAALLSLLAGSIFVGVTALTIGMWVVHQNPFTHPVVDLGFFALGAIIITSGFAVQLRSPEQKIAGVQQSVIGLLTLGVTGLIGGRVEPFTGSVLLLVATAILVALHPARRACFTLPTRLSPHLAALALLAAMPATAYAATMLIHARQAGPSCFFGQCAYGDRLAEMAALVMAIVVAGMLAASRPPGWRLTAWSVGVAAIIVGVASLGLPEVPGAFGQIGGALAVVWGMLFVGLAEREARHTAAPPDLAPRGAP